MKLSLIAGVFTLSTATLLSSTNVLAQSKKQRKAIAAANTQIDNNLKTFVAVLASDSLEGRRTGTAGEAKAVAYIQAYYQQLGIPGANNGSYQQPFVIDEGKVATASRLQLDEQVLLEAHQQAEADDHHNQGKVGPPDAGGFFLTIARQGQTV